MQFSLRAFVCVCVCVFVCVCGDIEAGGNTGAVQFLGIFDVSIIPGEH